MRGWLTAAVAAAGIAGSLVVWVAGIAGDAARTKEQLETVAKRQAEDRAEAKANLSEVKSDVKSIGADVQAILQKVTAIEAVQRTERRNERGR